MLVADKLQLQSALKQQATALKEKEFNLHRSNMGESQNQKTRRREGLQLPSLVFLSTCRIIPASNSFCTSIFCLIILFTIQ